MKKDTEQHYAALGLRPGSSLEQVHRAYRGLVEKWEKARTDDDPLLRRVREERLDTVGKSYRALVSFLEHPEVVIHGISPVSRSIDSVEKPKKELSPPEVRFEATSMPKRPSVLSLMALGLVALVLYGVTYHSLAGLLAESLGWSGSQVQFGMNVMVPLLIVALIEIGRRYRRS